MVAGWQDTLIRANVRTADAIIKAQLQDVEEIIDNAKGKQREGAASDSEVALRLYLEELGSCESVLSDRSMAQSMALAILSDENALEREKQIASDQQLAASLADRHGDGRTCIIPATSIAKNQGDPWQEQELLAKAAALYMTPMDEITASCQGMMSRGSSDWDDDVYPAAESSSQAQARAQARAQVKTSSICAACGEDKQFYDVARLPCNHEYCRACLDELFTLSMEDETVFPPRCDNLEIPLNQVRLFLSGEVAKEFEATYEELKTKNRVYCHDTACSTFISSQLVDRDNIATCSSCGKTTCVLCKAPSHTGDCPQDEALQQLIGTAEAQGWQRCYQCSAFVELDTGCNHMTCRCGAEFCYVCGTKWKECGCPQWHEARLLARAEQIADRNDRRNRAVTRAERVAAVTQHLRDNHNCTHTFWRSVSGQNRCEECSDTLSVYIYECQRCNLRACKRCRFNRL